MNQGLFDTYYFSTVPQAAANIDGAYQAVLPAMVSGSGSFNDANVQNGKCVLPNSRMRFYFKNGVAPLTGSPPVAASPLPQNYLPDYRKVSSNVLLNGAFNVNSTSVAAWRSLLSSPSNNAVSYLNSGGGGFSTALAGSPTLFPILRFMSPVQSGSAAMTSYASPYPWAGINVLSESSNTATGGLQLTALATSIVQQVKLRGPFLSMADFLNRRLDLVSGFQYKGALQAAIDDPSVNINTPLLNSGLGMATGTGTHPSRGTNPPSETLSQMPTPLNSLVGVPGWLTQQDLVQAFSPVMTVRSDTFVVRCYGESDNVVSGANQGRAWGEAVVQRLPDFIDQSDPNLSPPLSSANLGDATPLASVDGSNQTFGAPLQSRFIPLAQ